MKRQLLHTIIIPLFLLNFIFQYSEAQSFELSPTDSKMIVYGTSNLHDWTVTSSTFKGNINFKDLTNCEIKALNLEVPSTSLKSGKKGMDKNTYKALKTVDFPSVQFKLTKTTSVNKKDTKTYIINGSGSLTIIGNTKDIPVEFNVLTADNSICVEGSSTIKMTDFGVEPPKALFGTITTGDEIKIEYKLIFKLH